VLEVVGPGGIFGEMSLIEGDHVRSADAVAAEDSGVVVIPERQFDFMVEQTPRSARVLLTVLCERLRATTASAT
jgi:CRP-like cAMP-binding protein